MLLCCGTDGLLRYRTAWQPISCPLPAPTLIACQDGIQAVLDNTEHLLWMHDRLVSVGSSIESLLLWQGCPLLLSGDTDCLTLLDADTLDPLFLSPVGVYPQDMCLLPGNIVAVCGGGAGTVLLLTLPELQLLRSIPVPGSAQRMIGLGKWLYVLCTTEDDGLRTLLCRVNLQGSRYDPLCTLPGLPGALHADQHGLWVAASETLYRFQLASHAPTQTLGGFGLIRHITSRQHQLLLSDPVLGTLWLMEPGRPPVALLEGDVGQALFI